MVKSLLEIFTESETRTKHVRKDESESSDLIEQDSEEVKMDEDKDDTDEEVYVYQMLVTVIKAFD